ncbi:MAG: hypothetical protein HY862_16995 [Chloroflexi bacterium]|nr:hypothetical protein [Chloroflexota bacterium]
MHSPNRKQDDRLQLFDDLDRKDLRAATYTEPYFSYLNYTARPLFENLRNILQDWFDSFDAKEEKRLKVWKEFRSENNQLHTNAFFEIYLHFLLSRMGFHVEIEPEWYKNQPDFLLTSSNGQKILFEATNIFSDRIFGPLGKYEQKLIDALNSNLSSPDYFVGIVFEGSPINTPPYAQIVRHVQSEIDKLEYDQVVLQRQFYRNQGLFKIPDWKKKGWHIEFSISPKRKLRGDPTVEPIGWHMRDILWDQVNSIRTKLESKYSHYGDPDIPFVIAINIVAPFVSEIHTLEALFGDETLYVSASGQIVEGRESNGSWRESNRWQKTRISGVCIFDSLLPMNLHRNAPILWHHPMAAHPFPQELWRLDQKVPNHEQHGYIDLKGRGIAELLGLDISQLSE